MAIVEALPQFQSLSEETVLQALAETDPNNPIGLEVARLINGYTENLKSHIEQLGYFP